MKTHAKASSHNEIGVVTPITPPPGSLVKSLLRLRTLTYPRRAIKSVSVFAAGFRLSEFYDVFLDLEYKQLMR